MSSGKSGSYRSASRRNAPIKRNSAIFLAAKELFANHGIDRVTIEELAAEAARKTAEGWDQQGKYLEHVLVSSASATSGGG